MSLYPDYRKTHSEVLKALELACWQIAPSDKGDYAKSPYPEHNGAFFSLRQAWAIEIIRKQMKNETD